MKPPVLPRPSRASIPPTFIINSDKIKVEEEGRGRGEEEFEFRAEKGTANEEAEEMKEKEKSPQGEEEREAAEEERQREGGGEEARRREEEEGEVDPANLPVSHLRQRFEEQMKLQWKKEKEEEEEGGKGRRKRKLMTSGSMKARLEAFEEIGKEKELLPLWKPKIKVRRYFDANESSPSSSTPTSRNPSTDFLFEGNSELPPILEFPSSSTSSSTHHQTENGIILRPESPSSSSSSSSEDEDVYFESVEEIPSTPVPQPSYEEDSEITISRGPLQTPTLVISEITPEPELTNVLSSDPEMDTVEMPSAMEMLSADVGDRTTAQVEEQSSATLEPIPSSPTLEEPLASHPDEIEEQANVTANELQSNVTENEPQLNETENEPQLETESQSNEYEATPPPPLEPQSEALGGGEYEEQEHSKKRESQEMMGNDSKLDENEAPWLAESVGEVRERKKRRVPTEDGQTRWDTTLSMSFDPNTLFSSSPPRSNINHEAPAETSMTSSRTSTFNYSDFSVRYQLEKKAMKQQDEWILLDDADIPAAKARPRVTTQHHRSATMISDDISFVGKVGNLVASQLTQQQRLRQESIFELIFSEQCFRDDMKRVIEVYLEPLKKESILSPKELDKMFSNLTDLYDFSCVFSAALVKRQDEDNFVVNRVGNIIQQYVGGMIIFGPYTRNYSSVMQDFQDRLEWHEEFVEFIAKCRAQADPPMEMDLKGNLIKPLQRLTKMPLLVSAILKHTPSDHEDYEDLMQASELIQQVVTEVNLCT